MSGEVLTPHRVQLSRAKGWRMPADTVKVDRSTRYGNPFYVGKDGTANDCVRLFRLFLCAGVVMPASADGRARARRIPSIESLRSELRGKNLACWCALDATCHADVLLELANSEAAA